MKILLPIFTVFVLLAAQLMMPRSDVQPKKFMYLTVYAYDLPSSALNAGTHTYQFSFRYSSPRPGELIGKPHPFELDDSAPLYRGYVLLRPGGLQALVDTSEGADCKVVKKLNSRQSLRFFVAWVADEHLTVEETNRQISSMKAEIQIDGNGWIPLEKLHTTLSWEPLWNCQPWIVKTPAGSTSS